MVFDGTGEFKVRPYDVGEVGLIAQQAVGNAAEREALEHLLSGASRAAEDALSAASMGSDPQATEEARALVRQISSAKMLLNGIPAGMPIPAAISGTVHQLTGASRSGAAITAANVAKSALLYAALQDQAISEKAQARIHALSTISWDISTQESRRAIAEAWYSDSEEVDPAVLEYQKSRMEEALADPESPTAKAAKEIQASSPEKREAVLTLQEKAKASIEKKLAQLEPGTPEHDALKKASRIITNAEVLDAYARYQQDGNLDAFAAAIDKPYDAFVKEAEKKNDERAAQGDSYAQEVQSSGGVEQAIKAEDSGKATAAQRAIVGDAKAQYEMINTALNLRLTRDLTIGLDLSDTEITPDSRTETRANLAMVSSTGLDQGMRREALRHLLSKSEQFINHTADKNPDEIDAMLDNYLLTKSKEANKDGGLNQGFAGLAVHAVATAHGVRLDGTQKLEVAKLIFDQRVAALEAGDHVMEQFWKDQWDGALDRNDLEWATILPAFSDAAVFATATANMARKATVDAAGNALEGAQAKLSATGTWAALQLNRDKDLEALVGKNKVAEVKKQLKDAGINIDKYDSSKDGHIDAEELEQAFIAARLPSPITPIKPSTSAEAPAL